MDYIGACLQYADGVIVNAKAVQNELKELAGQLGQKLPSCVAVPLGADYSKESDCSKEASCKMDATQKEAVLPKVREAVLSGPYVLMVGTIEPRKNHKLLIEAYDKGLKEMGYHVILAGYMGWNMEEFTRMLEEHPDSNKGIYHFEGLDDANISYLYQNAGYLAFCSYSEGFGLPLIEAIYRGTPVVASDIPVSREVVGEYCIFFEQDNALDLCRKIKETDKTEGCYEMWKKKLGEYRAVTWSESAAGMKKALKSLYEGALFNAGQ